MTQLRIATSIKSDVFQAARNAQVDFHGNPISLDDSATLIHGHDYMDVTNRIVEIARESIEQDGAEYGYYTFPAYGLNLAVVLREDSEVRYYMDGVEVEMTEWDVTFA